MMKNPQMVPIRDQQIRAGGITKYGRSGFHYHEVEKFGKFIRYSEGNKIEEVYYKTLGDFLDAIKAKYNFDIPEGFNREQKLKGLE
jgi:hypothetical protein